MELALPLAATDTIRHGELVSVAAVCTYWACNLCPAVISKPVSELAGYCTIVNSLPKVGAALIVPIHHRLLALFATT